VIEVFGGVCTVKIKCTLFDIFAPRLTVGLFEIHHALIAPYIPPSIFSPAAAVN
jgi:hypothetical protein